MTSYSLVLVQLISVNLSNFCTLGSKLKIWVISISSLVLKLLNLTHVVLNHRKYALNILQNTGLLGAKLSRVPIEANHYLSTESGSPLIDDTPYRSLLVS